MSLSQRYFLRLSLIIFYILIFLVKPGAQCNPPGQIPTSHCEFAPLVCLNNYCAETIDTPFVCCSNFCGQNTIINNPQYFKFIPNSQDVEIDIHVDNCNAGTGLQSAIVSSCSWAPCPSGIVPCTDILACNPGSAPGQTMVLQASNLVVGIPYWLLIDGTNGATCHYTVEYVAGIEGPQLTNELDSALTMAIPNVIYQGYNNFHLVTGPLVGNAHGYYWTTEWDNQTYTSSVPEIFFNIPFDAPIGIWNICVGAFSGCDTTENEICIQVEIVQGINKVKEPTSFYEYPVSIFPNPSNGQFQIQLPDNSLLPVQWSVIDPTGIAYESGKLSENASTLNLEKMIPGLYFIKLKMNNQPMSLLKIIIE